MVERNQPETQERTGLDEIFAFILIKQLEEFMGISVSN